MITAEVREDGCLVVYAETHTEAYALKQWMKNENNFITIDTGMILKRDYGEVSNQLKKDKSCTK